MRKLKRNEYDKSYVIATGNDPMDKFLSSLSYVNNLGYVKDLGTLYDGLMFYEPDVLIVTTSLKGEGDLLKILLNAKEVLKDLRIILMLNRVSSSSELVDLSYLCDLGVYDIYVNKKITSKDLENMIKYEKDKEDTLIDLEEIEKGTYIDTSKDIEVKKETSKNENKEVPIEVPKTERDKKEISSPADVYREAPEKEPEKPAEVASEKAPEPVIESEPIRDEYRGTEEPSYSAPQPTLPNISIEKEEEKDEEMAYESAGSPYIKNPYAETYKETYRETSEAQPSYEETKIEPPTIREEVYKRPKRPEPIKEPEKAEPSYNSVRKEEYSDSGERLTRDLYVSNGAMEEHVVDNLSIISSIKPGTGKSFLSVNVACAIARYGKKTKEGRPPRVALIEGDLQNLSIGTLLQLEDSKKNLKSVMDKISNIVTKEGDFIGNPYQVESVNEYIKSSFLPYGKLKNLECLVGSQLSFEEIEDIVPYYYVYLVEAIAMDFDVVIVDTNSALTHVTTFPLLQMAKNCFYILNLDFNNIRNNTRYRETLRSIGVLDKVKYVLNEDITKEVMKGKKEELIYTSDHLHESGFDLVGKIPLIDKVIFLNRLYNGTPVVLDEGNPYTEPAKRELLKVANEIYPIEGFREDGKKKQEGRKGFFRF